MRIDEDEDTGRVTYLGTGIATLAGAKRYLRGRFRQSPRGEVVQRPGARFYVSLHRGRSGPVLLLGPFVSHLTALERVPRARRLLDGAGFAAVGTCSLLTSEPTRFGR